MDRFVFPRSFYESIKTLKPAYREALYTGIFDFIFEDTEPELKSVELKRMWMLIFPILSKAKKISNTISTQSKDNLKRMSRDTKENVERRSAQSKENVETISGQSPFKEKDKEKDIRNIPPKSPRGYSEEFEKFWKEYPRHDAKQDAFRAFNKAIKDTTPDNLLKSVRKFKDTEAWQRDDGKYIPYAASWLNGRRWEDDIPEEEPVEDRQAPYVEECPICHTTNLFHSLNRYKCNECNLIWDWNPQDKKWEVSL